MSTATKNGRPAHIGSVVTDGKVNILVTGFKDVPAKMKGYKEVESATTLILGFKLPEADVEIDAQDSLLLEDEV